MNTKVKLIMGFLALSVQLIFSKADASTSTSDINISAFGAKPDGSSDNTAIIQKAIDQCAESGGGTVHFPPGIYMSGTIFLKTNVSIHLAKSSVLKGIAADGSYPVTRSGKKGFIRIDNVSNITISGEGTIDGSGDHEVFQKGDNAILRPFLLECLGSDNIVVKGVRLQNSAFWTFHIFESNGVRVDGVSIYSHSNFNNDGIDIDSKNVIISNCLIDTDDDALCFKSDGKLMCENVTVSNCILASNCNFIKFGTSSYGGFKNIVIGNCALRPATESKFRHWDRNLEGVTDKISGISGIALEIVDGGTMDQVAISNIAMSGVQTPIFMRLGSRKNPTGSLKNILISNIVATTHSKIPSSIVGVPGFHVENVVLRDIMLNCMGTGSASDAARKVPENEKGYPENRMFGCSLPSYGLYVRHARDLELENIRVALVSPDARPAILLDDCHNVGIHNLHADRPSNDQPLIRMIDSTNVNVSRYQSIIPIARFLLVEGEKSSDIKLSGNDFSRVKNVSELGSGCKAATVKQLMNFQ